MALKLFWPFTWSGRIVWLHMPNIRHSHLLPENKKIGFYNLRKKLKIYNITWWYLYIWWEVLVSRIRRRTATMKRLFFHLHNALTVFLFWFYWGSETITPTSISLTIYLCVKNKSLKTHYYMNFLFVYLILRLVSL